MNTLSSDPAWKSTLPRDRFRRSRQHLDSLLGAQKDHDAFGLRLDPLLHQHVLHNVDLPQVARLLDRWPHLANQCFLIDLGADLGGNRVGLVVSNFDQNFDQLLVIGHIPLALLDGEYERERLNVVQEGDRGSTSEN
jgi:hypothetical protein